MLACTFTSKNEKLLHVVKAQSIIEHISSAVIFRGTVCNATTSGVVYINDKFARHVLCVAFCTFRSVFQEPNPAYSEGLLCRDSTSLYAMTISFHILSTLLFTIALPLDAI
jgi:hypothetical protein